MQVSLLIPADRLHAQAEVILEEMRGIDRRETNQQIQQALADGTRCISLAKEWIVQEVINAGYAVEIYQLHLPDVAPVDALRPSAQDMRERILSPEELAPQTPLAIAATRLNTCLVDALYLKYPKVFLEGLICDLTDTDKQRFFEMIMHAGYTLNQEGALSLQNN